MSSTIQILSGRESAEWASLQREPDAELRAEGLLHLAGRLERRGNESDASAIYHSLLEENSQASNRARQRLEVLQGGGALGARAERLLRHFVEQATDPAMLVGMGVAGTLAPVVRTGILARLAAAPTSLFTRGLPARFLAGTGALALEAPVFTVSARFTHSLLSRPQDSSLQAWGHELASGYLLLGALRLSGTLVQAMPRNPSSPLFHQVGLFGGVLAAHGAEVALGLRPPQPFDAAALDALATVFQFQVGGRLSHALLGEGHAAFNREVMRRGRDLQSPTGLGGVSMESPTLAMAGGGRSSDLRFPIFMMSSKFGGRGTSSRAKPPTTSPRPEVSKLWSDWLASRPSPAPRYFDIPSYDFSGPAEFHEAIRRAASSVPEGCRCLFLEVQTMNGYGELQSTLENILATHASLREVRVRFQDGRLLWVVKEDQKFMVENEEYNSRDPIHRGHDIPLAELSRARLRPPWTRMNGLPPMPDLLRQSRQEAGFSIEEVLRRIAAEPSLVKEMSYYNAQPPSRKRLVEAEGSSGQPLHFPALKFLAELYGQDISRWIAASNSTYYPDLPKRAWESDRYPLYIESKDDASWAAALNSAGKGRGRGSLGWVIFSARKNPERYFSLPELAERVGLEVPTLIDLQENRYAPNGVNLDRLVDHFNIPEATIVAAIGRSFYSGLGLAELFPGQEIYLAPRSRDFDKVEGFRRNPGSLGQYLFAARKARPGFATVENIAQEVGRSVAFIHGRESNSAAVKRENLHEWYDLWRRMELPDGLFRQIVAERHGIPVDHPVHSLAEALEGRSYEEVSANSTISTKVLQGLAEGRSFGGSTLVEILKALPRMNGAHLYLRSYPDLPVFFAETTGSDPRLNLAPEEVRRVFREFHFGETLFAHRMNAETPLSTVELGRQLEWNSATVGNHEKSFARIEQNATLLRIADVLGVDHRALYLYFRPEILRFFPLHHPETGAAWTLDPRFYAELTAPSRGAYDRNNLRRRLATAIMSLPLKRRESGEIDEAATLSQALNISESYATRLLDPTHPLNTEAITLLAQRFPNFSYREMYEHFNRASLAYFLGRDAEGRIDYRIPDGLDFAGLGRLDMMARLEVAAREGGEATALRALRVTLRRGGEPSDATLA
ncbi:MAG TPA: hypothetical protein VJP40_06635, partial [bacterium]|nr:hypothetical protein [bacterium]